MNNNDSPEDIRPMGRGMLMIFWVMVLGLMTWALGGWQERKDNPNRDPLSADTGQYREVILESNRQHHYVAGGKINNRPVTFLLDTGATDVVVPEQLARSLGLQKGQSHMASTANGNVRVYSTLIDRLQLGSIELRDVRASINPGMKGKGVLLGMSALRNIEFRQRDGKLTLRQYPAG
jgi:aspartyl protease family protein